MSIASIAVEKKAVTYFATFLLTVGGIGAFFGLGQLEDPAYTVKTAQIFAEYPGVGNVLFRNKLGMDQGNMLSVRYTRGVIFVYRDRFHLSDFLKFLYGFFSSFIAISAEAF